MPNWCSSSYVLVGSADEVKKLYGIMKKLERRKKAFVENGFGITWLGCLVDALGEDWKKVSCRGEWNAVCKRGNTLRFTTETAWGPCNETLDLVCEKFPSLRYYYQTEEPGMGIYETNDSESRYFPDKFRAEVYTLEDEYYSEYFTNREAMFEWLEEIFGQPVTSETDVERIMEQWKEKNEQVYCSVVKYEIVE